MLRKVLVILVVLLFMTVLFSGCFGPEEEPKTKVRGSSYQGVSWTEVIPEKAAMLVQHDPESYIDDYSFLAGVPASVFYDETSDKLISYPLIFYENPNIGTGQLLTLNGGQGVEYFMEDWMTYSDSELDVLQLVNVEESGTVSSKWSAKNVIDINANSMGVWISNWMGNPYFNRTWIRTITQIHRIWFSSSCVLNSYQHNSYEKD